MHGRLDAFANVSGTRLQVKALEVEHKACQIGVDERVRVCCQLAILDLISKLDCIEIKFNRVSENCLKIRAFFEAYPGFYGIFLSAQLATVFCSIVCLSWWFCWFFWGLDLRLFLCFVINKKVLTNYTLKYNYGDQLCWQKADYHLLLFFNSFKTTLF